MTTDTPASPIDVKEWCRLPAWELRRQGWTERAFTTALGVTPGAVSPWLRRAREQGVAALRRRPPPGAMPKLTAAQPRAARHRLEPATAHPPRQPAQGGADPGVARGAARRP